LDAASDDVASDDVASDDAASDDVANTHGFIQFIGPILL